MLQLDQAIKDASIGKVMVDGVLVERAPWPVDFLEIRINSSTIIRLTNHFHDVVATSVIGEEILTNYTYTAAAQFLSFSSITNDLEVKDNSLDLSLSGVGQEGTAFVLANPIEGARVFVSRSYFNEDEGTMVADPYQRWAGRVNSYNIQDDYNFSDEDKIIITLACRSLLLTLLERVSGRYMSQQGFAQFESYYDTPAKGDKSMEYVANLTSFSPDFGKGNWSGGGGGGKHLCTRYWEFGDITDEIFIADNDYRKLVDDKLYNWYSRWAEPLAESIEKDTLKYYICKPFVRAWSNSMAYKMGVTDRRSRFGEFLEWLGNLLSR